MVKCDRCEGRGELPLIQDLLGSFILIVGSLGCMVFCVLGLPLLIAPKGSLYIVTSDPAKVLKLQDCLAEIEVENAEPKGITLFVGNYERDKDE